MTFGFPSEILPSRGTAALYLSGGIIANGVLSLIALGLLVRLSWGASVWLVVLWLNGSLALGSLLPLEFKLGKAILRTDGALILAAIRERALVPSIPRIIQNVEFLQPLLTSIGDHVMVRLCLIQSALSWAELEDVDRATAALLEADAVPLVDPEPPIVRAQRGMAVATIAHRAGRLDEAGRAYTETQSLLGALGNPTSLFLGEVFGATARLTQGDVLAAAAEFDALAARPIARRPLLAIWLLESRLQCRAAMSDVPGVEELVAAYEKIRPKAPSASHDLRVYKTVAKLFSGREDWPRAEPAYRRAVDAVVELSNEWVEIPERARFLERHAALVDEARNCLVAQGKAEDANRLGHLIADPEELEHRRREGLQKRYRRLRRLGLRIMAGNLVASLGIIWRVGWSAEPDEGLWVLILMMLVFFTFSGLIYLFCHWMIGLVIPRLRTRGGAILVILACLPWLSAIFLLLMSLAGPGPRPR